MCKHNDDDYDCLDCCFELGVDDFLSGEPYNPPYKNFDQCDAYKDGWNKLIDTWSCGWWNKFQ